MGWAFLVAAVSSSDFVPLLRASRWAGHVTGCFDCVRLANPPALLVTSANPAQLRMNGAHERVADTHLYTHVIASLA
jgi:hypothetical protein